LKRFSNVILVTTRNGKINYKYKSIRFGLERRSVNTAEKMYRHTAFKIKIEQEQTKYF